MKYYKILGVLTLVCIISCDYKNNDDNNDENCITGSGSTITETPAVSDFHSIACAIAGNMHITQGSPAALSIETHPDVMDELNVEVNNEVLELNFDRCINNIETLEINVTMPDISSIVFSGAGNVTSVNDLNLDELTVVLSGAGNITLSGEVDEFNYVMSGAGNLKAFDLVTSECSITISGVGNAEITVTDLLDVVIAGIGSIYYMGSPSITHNITGTGNLIDSN